MRLVLPSENNLPVPALIHHSDSAWPRGNERINKRERSRRADEVKHAGKPLSQHCQDEYCPALIDIRTSLTVMCLCRTFLCGRYTPPEVHKGETLMSVRLVWPGV